MKTKLLTLLTLLLCVIASNAKIVPVTVALTGANATTYTYTSSDESVSVAFEDMGSNYSSTRAEIVKTTTMTITVPTGGLISSLVFTMNGTGTAGNFTYTLTNNTGGGNIFTAKSGDVTFDFPTAVATSATFVFGTDNDSKSPYARVTSMVVKYDDGIAETAVADPIFTPEGCEFNTSISVTLSTDTDGATIYYTTDGTTPTSASAVYSQALNLTATTTIKAIGIKAGLDDSDVISQTYTLVDDSDPTAISDFRFIDFSELTGSNQGVQLKVSRTEGDYKMVNDKDYPMTIYTTDETVDGYHMVRYVNLGGGSSESRRLIQVNVTGPSKIIAWGKAAGSSGTRKIVIAKSSWSSSGVANAATNTTSWTSVEYTYTEASTETFYIGGDNNIHIAAILVAPIVNVSMNTKGYATYSAAYDFTFSGEGIKAYWMALDEDNKTITGTEVTGKIKAGEGILFRATGSANSAEITATTGATALEDNDLKGSTKSNGTLADKPDYCYVLSGDTFVSYTGASLVANKAYFEASKDLSVNARPFTITFEGETTSVADVRGKMSDVRSEYFDLQGRRVAQPSKGLYIVNGKKVVIK